MKNLCSMLFMPIRTTVTAARVEPGQTLVMCGRPRSITDVQEHRGRLIAYAGLWHMAMELGDTFELVPRGTLSSTAGTTPQGSTKESEPTMATRTRPKRSRTRTAKPAPATEPEVTDELDGLDVDDLDGLDIDTDDIDLDDLDLDLEPEVVAEPEADDFEEDAAPPRRKRGSAPVVVEDDDDLDLDDLDDDDEPEPAPSRSRKPKPAAAKQPARKPAPVTPKSEPTKRERPLTDAMVKMLTAAHKLKQGAPVENIGQTRTADALVARKLVRYVPKSDKTRIETTAAGAKHLGKAKREPVVFKATAAPKPAPAAKTAAKPKPAARTSKPAARTGGVAAALPKGMVGVAAIAKAAGVHEETVRRVLRLNEDRFTQHESGRWAFTKPEAKEVLREVRSYVRYTGGTRGRPSGATTTLPDGKVGPAYIAEKAGVHRNTVYNFLRKHEDRFSKFKAESGYAFTEAQADKIAAKLAR